MSPETLSWDRLTPHSSDKEKCLRVLKPFHPYKQLESKSYQQLLHLSYNIKNKQTIKQAKNVDEDEKSQVKHGDVLPELSTGDTTMTGSIGLHYSF